MAAAISVVVLVSTASSYLESELDQSSINRAKKQQKKQQKTTTTNNNKQQQTTTTRLVPLLGFHQRGHRVVVFALERILDQSTCILKQD
jgi:hypothetical protein